MSSPVRGAAGPLGYAPRWARTTESGRAGTAFDAKLRTSTTARESPRDFRPPLVVMSLRKTVSPQEMVPSTFAAVGRLVRVMILAAAGVLGFLWLTAPRGVPPQLASNPRGGEVALASYRPQKSRSPTVPLRAAPMANYARDATDGVNASPAAPAIPAAPRVPASRVTVPPPTTPAAAAPTPAHAVAAAPPFPAPPTPASRAVVPAVTAAVVPPPAPPVAAPDHNEVSGLLARGRAYLSEGDVALARLYLRRAAELYDPQAALALGGTYDLAELRRMGIPNVQAQADPAKAREWYRRAADSGSAAAALRLERLP